jgi:hypothetical protein
MSVTNLQEKYGHKYKVVDDGTDDACRAERVWCQEIRGRRGVIYPYGYNGSLAVRFDSKTKSKTAAWVTRLLAEGYALVQCGDWEVIFKFDPSKFEYFAGLIQAKRRRRLTPEQRAKAELALVRARTRLRHE